MSCIVNVCTRYITIHLPGKVEQGCMRIHNDSQYSVNLKLSVYLLNFLFISSLRAFIIFLKLFLMSCSSTPYALGCSGLNVLELLVSCGATLLFMFLNMFLHCLPPMSSANWCRWSLWLQGSLSSNQCRWLLLLQLQTGSVTSLVVNVVGDGWWGTMLLPVLWGCSGWGSSIGCVCCREGG